MSILVIDGMGGGLGAQIVMQLRQQMPDREIIAVGTNSVATTNMVKAGANKGATGANAVRVCLRNAACVVGPIGIIIADSMLGEITAEIAALISGAPVPKVLVPVNHKNLEIVGLQAQPTMAELIKATVQRVKEITGNRSE
ncbi:MAG: DUF3842 family protein [Peptococcaceae bacterium]|jgi:hypothetical protein|nr:DUF3842 family protein [Peptococcaceae bacterium]MDH7525065.1 DUF3842 family protein [Peptococcaceae bacterium]